MTHPVHKQDIPYVHNGRFEEAQEPPGFRVELPQAVAGQVVGGGLYGRYEAR